MLGYIPIILSNVDGSDPQPEFESLCVNAIQSLQSGTHSFVVQPTPADTGLPNGEEIAYLYNKYGYFLYNNPNPPPTTFTYGSDGCHLLVRRLGFNWLFGNWNTANPTLLLVTLPDMTIHPKPPLMPPTPQP